jgi:hypothetical protein
MILPNVNLNINYFELGYLYASIKDDAWDRMPRTLWLKLHISTTFAYLKHEKFGKQAKKDIDKWLKELKTLEDLKGGQNGKKLK